MPTIKSIADLFRAGGSFVAEQFIRGTSKASSLADLFIRKFGDGYTLPGTELSTFEGYVRNAAIPAQVVQTGGSPRIETVPPWIGGFPPDNFVHSGLAKISIGGTEEEPAFQTRIPFEMRNVEIFRLEEIKKRIEDAIRNTGNDDELYQNDLDRINDLIRYQQIIGSEPRVDPTLYSIFQNRSE